MGTSSRVPLALAIAPLVLAVPALHLAPTANGEQSMSTLTVTVQFVILSGVPPGGGREAGSPRLLPAVDVVTWVVPEGGPVTPPQATATTDAAGVAAFMLPAGAYWAVGLAQGIERRAAGPLPSRCGAAPSVPLPRPPACPVLLARGGGCPPRV